MTYNLTDLQNADSMLKLITYANNTATESWFMVMMIVAIWFIIFMVLLRYGFPRNALVSSFLCFVLGLFLLYMKLIASIFVFAFLGLTIAFTLWMAAHPD